MNYSATDTTRDGIRSTERTLSIALLRARERVMHPIRKLLTDAGLTEAQWRVLRVLQEISPTDATQVAHEACLLMPSLTRIIQGLEEKGLTLRKAHPSDGRKALIYITDAGHALMAKHVTTANRIFADLERDFGEERIELLLDLLNELSELKE